MSRSTLNLDGPLYEYLLAHSLREHPAQTALREATLRWPRAGMQISPEQGQLLTLLLRLTGARRAIEIGVFTGYSALTTALALPADGRLLACDISASDASLGQPYWESAGVAGKIDFVVAPADQTLGARIVAGEGGSYDFAFIDADKTGYDAYYERCLQLLRVGGLAVLDNTLRGGEVAYEADSDATRALQLLNDKIHADQRVDMVLLPFSDGITLARKR